MLFDPKRMARDAEKDLIALRKRWYKILKRKGFDDIEVLAPNGRFYDLLRYPFRMDLNSPQRKVQQKYFSLARAFVYEFSFKNSFQKKVWLQHSEGISYRKIARAMKTGEMRVYKTICRLRKKMMESYLNERDRED